MEQRRARRINTELKVLMEPIYEGHVKGQPILADVVNVSKSGVGFMTVDKIEDYSFFRARLVFKSKESVDTVIETIRHEPGEDGKTCYGGRFVALSETDQFKIEVFRLFAENEANS